MKKSLTNGQVKSTTEYHLFSHLDENRDINQNYVKLLAASISESNNLHLKPIIVTEDLEVIDGQHRLEAAKILELPIFYVVDENYNPKNLIDLNNLQRGWAPDDYINYWITQGNEEYSKLRDFMKDIGFKTRIVMHWLSKDSSRAMVAFKRGAFKFQISHEKLDALFSTKRLMDYLKSVQFKQTTIYNQSSFHRACRDFFMNVLVEKDRFFEKLEQVHFKITYTPSFSEYLDQLVDIYNYDQKKHRIKVIQDGKKRELIA